MNKRPTTSEITALGISKSYASEIANGKRAPSRALAIHIYRQTGWKHDTIVALTDEQITVLESLGTWQRPTKTTSPDKQEKGNHHG